MSAHRPFFEKMPSHVAESCILRLLRGHGMDAGKWCHEVRRKVGMRRRVLADVPPEHKEKGAENTGIRVLVVALDQAPTLWRG